MADNDPTDPNPAQNNQAPPAGNSKQDQKGTSPDKDTSASVAMAKELGETKAKLEAAQARVSQIEPVLETIYSNEELLKKATEVHNKRLGVTPPDKPAEPVKPSPETVDTRNSQIKMIVDKFSEDHGIDKLDAEGKKAMNEKVGNELGEMLDPMGNKTLQQILETVSLTKLPHFLEKAYTLATKDQIVKDAEDRGRQKAIEENTGIIGTMASSSINPENITLTAAQKKVAQGLGIPEDKYLERVKEITAREGQLY